MVCGFGLFGVLLTSYISYRLAYAMVFSVGLLSGAGPLVAAVRIRPGSVRVRDLGPLEFFPQRLPRFLLVSSLVAVLGYGVVLCASWMAPGMEPIFQTRPGGPYYRSGGFVQGILMIGAGGGFLIYLARRFLVSGPRGLEVSPVGLRWRESQHPEVTVIQWDDLREVSIGVVKRARVLTICDSHDSVYFRGQSQLASDPVTVAEIIIYFRDHAEQRHLLNDRMRALAAVSDIRRVGLA